MTDIRQLLVDANPVPRAEVPDTVRAELFAEVRRTPPPARRRWRWPLPTILIALVTVGGVATAGGLFISQETRGKSAALRAAPDVDPMGRPGLESPELRAAAERIVSTTPYPPDDPEDYSWAPFRTSEGREAADVRSLQMLIEFRASCKWRGYWLRMQEAGSTAAAAEAAEVLAEVPDWPTFRSREGTARERAQQAAAAAAAGDVDVVQELNRGDCRV